MMAGTIAARWTATCGVCGAKQELRHAHGTRLSALAAANSHGWHHRIKRGWLCPVCWYQGDNMQIVCDLIDLAEMLEGIRLALMTPPRADKRLRDLRDYICAHCADTGNGHKPRRCTFCKIREKNT